MPSPGVSVTGEPPRHRIPGIPTEPREFIQFPSRHVIPVRGLSDRASMSNFVTVTSPATTLSVTSNPPGALVFIDNVIKGRTPLTLTDTAIGDHRITITLDGYEEYTRNIVVESVTPLTIAASTHQECSTTYDPATPKRIDCYHVDPLGC